MTHHFNATCCTAFVFFFWVYSTYLHFAPFLITNNAGAITDLSALRASSDRTNTPRYRLSSPPSHLSFIDSAPVNVSSTLHSELSLYALKDLQRGSRIYRQEKSILQSSKEAQSPADLHPAAPINLSPSTDVFTLNLILSKLEYILYTARQDDLIQSCKNWFDSDRNDLLI